MEGLLELNHGVAELVFVERLGNMGHRECHVKWKSPFSNTFEGSITNQAKVSKHSTLHRSHSQQFFLLLLKLNRVHFRNFYERTAESQ